MVWSTWTRLSYLMFASTDGLDPILPMLINTYLRNAIPLLTGNLFSLEHVEFGAV